MIEKIEKLIRNSGLRKWSFAMSCELCATFLAYYDKLPPEKYVMITLALIGAFLGSNVYENYKKTNGTSDTKPKR